VVLSARAFAVLAGLAVVVGGFSVHVGEATFATYIREHTASENFGELHTGVSGIGRSQSTLLM